MKASWPLTMREKMGSTFPHSPVRGSLARLGCSLKALKNGFNGYNDLSA